MSVILVVEQDTAYANRISSVLRTAGRQVEITTDIPSAEALPVRPGLVLVSGTLPDAPRLLGNFHSSKGAGSVVVLPISLAGQVDPRQYNADRVLPKPFSDEELLGIVGQLLPIDSGLPQGQLTSADIFGDVLAEVEAEAQANEGRRRRPRSDHSDIDRKLEETLSGFFPDKLRAQTPEPAAPAAPKPKRRRDVPSADEIEDLLDKTLSSLELPSRGRRPRDESTAPAAGANGVPAAPQPAPVVPTIPARPSLSAQPEPSAPAPAQASAPLKPAAPPTLPPLPPIPVPGAPPAKAEDPPQKSDWSVAPAEAPAPPSPPAPAPPAPLSWDTSSFARPEAGGFSLQDDAPASLPEPEYPTSFAPDDDWGSADGSALGTPGPSTSFEATPPATFDTPSSFDFPAQAAEPPFETPASFTAQEEPPFESPGSFATTTPLADRSPFSSPAELAAPESIASFDAPPPFEPATSFGAEPASPSSLDSAPSFAPTPFDASPTFGETAGEAPFEPAFEPPTSFDSSAPFDPVASFDSSAPFESPTSFDSSAPFESPISFDSPAPDESPTPDPFAASRHGEHPADFASAFAMPAREPAPGEDSTDRLQEALDGVLQIRGDRSVAGSEPEGTPFGDYRLLERIAVGGMAEVWRARRKGVEGFQKTVAIKKILSHLTGSSDFVTMFIDEAKLAAQLTHANIVQIYDLGKVEDDFYIAMEYIEGKDLRSILNRATDIGRPMPVGLALQIVSALARALDYAHRKRDFENRAMGLVHRDVSPQNVLISYEGEIKLCDFGIVKAVAKASTTQMGALKGKLQYMSPEQAWGKEVDARSDIFSLGSVLFEVLTGQRLFTGDSEIGVLDAVRDCRIRSPKELVPELPPEIDRIALKALAPTPEARYQTAGELERDLQSVIETVKPGAGQAEMAAYMDELFRDPTAAPAAPPIAQPASEPAAPQPVAPAKPRGRAKTFLIAAIILAALATIGFIAYSMLDTGSSSAPSTATPAEPPKTVPQPAPVPAAAEDDTAEPGGESPDEAQGESDADTEGTEGAEAKGEEGGENGVDVQSLVQQALDSERERLDAEYADKERRLQEELKKVQKSSGGNS